MRRYLESGAWKALDTPGAGPYITRHVMGTPTRTGFFGFYFYAEVRPPALT